MELQYLLLFECHFLPPLVDRNFLFVASVTVLKDLTSAKVFTYLLNLALLALSGAHRADLDNGRCSGGNRRLSGVILRVRMGLVHQIIISTECVLRLNPLRLYYRLQCIQFYLAISLKRQLLLNDLCKERSLDILQISDRNELRCRLGLHRWSLGKSRIVNLLYKGIVGAVGCLVAAAAALD